jgi:hypothetical protein
MALYLAEIARIVGCTGMDVKLKESGTSRKYCGPYSRQTQNHFGKLNVLEKKAWVVVNWTGNLVGKGDFWPWT